MKITLYTIANSPFCVQARDYLKGKNLPFEEKDVELSKDSLHEMLTVSDRFAGVPYAHVVLDDGTEAGLKGFTLQEYDQLFNQAQNSYTPVSTPDPVQSVDPTVPIVSTPPTQTAMPEESTMSEASQAPQMPQSSAPADLDAYKAEESVPTQVEPAQQEPAQPSSQLGSIMDNLMQHTSQASSGVPQQVADQNAPISPSVPSEAHTENVVDQPAVDSSEVPTEIPTQSQSGSISIPDFPSK